VTAALWPELAGRLADLIGDGIYTWVLGERDITSY
jgi:hypothetical protein